jgi:hypothetical protein
VVSNYFDMGDWEADEQVRCCQRMLYKWLVPAWVAGIWRCVVRTEAGESEHMQLKLRRRYQYVTGSAAIGGRTVPLRDGKLMGDELTFRVADPRRRDLTVFSAKVEGKCLRGACRPEEVNEGQSMPWAGTWQCAEQGAAPDAARGRI